MTDIRTQINIATITTRNSANLTNQRISYAFISSPFSIHDLRILPTSKFQHSDSCTVFCLFSVSVNSMYEITVSVNTVHWLDTSSSGNPNE